jgi:probable phosphoglycerate mutase
MAIPPNKSRGNERFRGLTDLPLDETGHAQARAICRRLRDEPIAAIYTSPLLRTQQTAAPLAEALFSKQLPILPHDGLLDIDYGQFQGLTHTEASRAYPVEYRLWRASPSQVRFPEGEGLAQVRARVLALFEELTAAPPPSHRDGEPTLHKYESSDETVVLVGHQIANKVISCTLLGIDLDQIWRLRQDTGCLNVYQQVGGLWRVLRLNDTFHLQEV